MPMNATFYSVVDLAAGASAIVALVVWMIPALQLLRRIDLGEARVKVFWSCVVFSAPYGAACGSLYGVVLSLPSAQGPPWDLIFWGAVGGAFLGAFGGGVAGFFG